MRKVNTKKHIIQTAVELFNGVGHARVSTNHIADACGLSTGNLYYHFKNKDDIIREVFYLIDTKARDILAIVDKVLARSESISPQIIPLYLAGLGQLLNEYRFFFRELPEILRENSCLLEDYKQLEVLFVGKISLILEKLGDEDGILKPFSCKQDREYLSEFIWIFCISWLSITEIVPHNGVPPIEVLFRRLFYLIKPYLKNDHVDEVEALFIP